MPTRKLIRDFGKCLLSGAAVGDLITVSNLGGTTIGDTYSVSFWAKFKSMGNTTEARIFNKGVDLVLLKTNKAAQVNHSGTVATSLANYTPYDEVWRHYVITYDGANAKFYRNGALFDTQAITQNPTDTAAVLTFINRTSESRAIDGKIDEIAFYKNKALSLAEIEGIYYNGTYPSGLLLHYKLDEGSGTTATDTSGNGNNGTITSATYSTDVVMVPRTSV